MNRYSRNYNSQTGPPKGTSSDHRKPITISIEPKASAKSKYDTHRI